MMGRLSMNEFTVPVLDVNRLRELGRAELPGRTVQLHFVSMTVHSTSNSKLFVDVLGDLVFT
jgi:hypothetical protein